MKVFEFGFTRRKAGSVFAFYGLGRWSGQQGWSYIDDIFSHFHFLSNFYLFYILPFHGKREQLGWKHFCLEALCNERAWSRAKTGCYDKSFCNKKSKIETFIDRLFPHDNYATCCYKCKGAGDKCNGGVLSSDFWLHRKWAKSYVYMTHRDCNLFWSEICPTHTRIYNCTDKPNI